MKNIKNIKSNSKNNTVNMSSKEFGLVSHELNYLDLSKRK
jgi:hypothetical protein